MIGVFARANHPEGWGYPPPESGGPGGTAHGYVVVLVQCSSDRVLEAVKTKLAMGFAGVPADSYSQGDLGKWFGGQFDYLYSTPSDELDLVGHPFSCRGDNRFVGIYGADEVLAS